MLAALPLILTVILLPLATAGRDLGVRGMLMFLSALVGTVLVRVIARLGRGLLVGFMPSLSVLWAQVWSGWAGIEGSIVWVWYALLFFLSCLVTGRARESLLGASMLSLMLQCVWGWFIWLSRGESQALIFGTFYAANQFAGFLVLLAPLLVSIAIKASRPIVTVSAAALAALAYASLLLSGSRGGIAAGVVGLALLFIFSSKRRLALALVVAAAGLLAMAAPFHPRFDREVQRSAISAKVSSGSAISLRAHWMSSALKMGLDAPLTGNGRDSFGTLLLNEHPSGDRWSKFVHNDYLERFVEGGFVSFALFAGFMGIVVAGGARAALRSDTDWAVGVWVGLVSSAAHVMVDHDWSEPGFAAVFMAMAGMLLGETKNRPPRGPVL